MKKSNKKGFTIVELVIVIAVIGILAAVLIPTFSGIIGDANEKAALQEARNAYTTFLASWNYAENGDPDIRYVVVDGDHYDVEDEFKIVSDPVACYNSLEGGVRIEGDPCVDVTTDTDHACDVCGKANVTTHADNNCDCSN